MAQATAMSNCTHTMTYTAHANTHTHTLLTNDAVYDPPLHSISHQRQPVQN